MRVKNIDKQKNIILDTFPVQFSENIIYNLLSNNIDVIYNEKERSRKYIVDIIDNYGYKYHIDFHHMMSSRGRYDCLNRFFYGNIYTYDNINLYCKLNNIDLYIDGKDLPVIGVARKKWIMLIQKVILLILLGIKLNIILLDTKIIMKK